MLPKQLSEEIKQWAERSTAVAITKHGKYFSSCRGLVKGYNGRAERHATDIQHTYHHIHNALNAT